MAEKKHWQDYTSIGDRVEAFDDEHENPNRPAIKRGGWLYFHTGAKREVNPHGPLMDPPTDPRELERAKAIYLKLVFDQASSRFSERKYDIEHGLATCVNAPGLINAPPQIDEKAMVAELTELRDKVRNAHRAYMRAQDAIDEMAPDSEKQRQERDQAARQTAREALSRVASIRL
ncbi:MAG: hypothetical protein GWP14_06925 [Actinobacteria bacterium]|nr:hypothetical protein [Actinomycetota bacterium]